MGFGSGWDELRSVDDESSGTITLEAWLRAQKDAKPERRVVEVKGHTGSRLA